MVRNFGERRKKKSGSQNKKSKTKKAKDESCPKGKVEIESREVVVYDPEKQKSTKNEEPKKPPNKKQQSNGGYRRKRKERQQLKYQGERLQTQPPPRASTRARMYDERFAFE